MAQRKRGNRRLPPGLYSWQAKNGKTYWRMRTYVDGKRTFIQLGPVTKEEALAAYYANQSDPARALSASPSRTPSGWTDYASLVYLPYIRDNRAPKTLEVETYRRRVDRRWPAEDRALKPVAGGRGDDPHRVLREEARVLDRALERERTMVVLDERGKTCTSEAFARRLRDLEDRSSPGIDFVVGSDLGLDRDLVRRAAWTLSLSPMTLPHPLARVMLWEQLFRATHILGGGGYHRGNVQ